MDNNFNEKEFLEKVEKAAMEGASKAAKGSFTADLIKSLLIKVMVPALIVVAVMMLILPRISLGGTIKSLFETEKPVEGHDMTIENHGILGYTAADFEKAILGDSSKLKKIEVLSYKVSDAVTITNTGLINLKIFTKNQLITYHGTAVYTIDLSQVTNDDITVNETGKTVTMRIPHSELVPINIQSSDIEFGDVEKGLLSFGDIKMTPQQQAEVQTEAQKRMTSVLEERKISEEADRFGKMAIWEMYQPLITAISPEYVLIITFR